MDRPLVFEGADPITLVRRFGLIRLSTSDGGVKTLASPAQWPTLEALVRGGEHFAVISLALRAGALDFTAKLEHGLFPPLTPSNDDFDNYYAYWLKSFWVVFILPLARKDEVFEFSETTSLIMRPEVPIAVSPRGLEAFPLPFVKDRVFTLENRYPVLQGREQFAEALKEADRFITEAAERNVERERKALKGQSDEQKEN